jgi:hypothetical protein
VSWSADEADEEENEGSCGVLAAVVEVGHHEDHDRGHQTDNTALAIFGGKAFERLGRGEERWLWRTYFEHLQARPAELVDAEPHETQVERVEERAHQSAWPPIPQSHEPLTTMT